MNRQEAKQEACRDLCREATLGAAAQMRLSSKRVKSDAYRRWLAYTELAEEMWRRAGETGPLPEASDYFDADILTGPPPKGFGS